MALPERRNKTPENDEELLASLEKINADENVIEREDRLNTFYEMIEEFNGQDDVKSNEELP